jgi:uncharacterized protein DUF4058
MPSPFPGMDPWIEDPEIWSDFHGDLAAEIRASLNGVISPRYVARLVPRVTYEEVDVARVRAIRPDVEVWRSGEPGERSPRSGGTALRAPAESTIPLEVPLLLYGIEVRQTATMQLVTAIEILSPVNKRRSHEAHESYLRKRREVLRSEVHLLEIDLLRAGERPPLSQPVPASPYYVVLSRVDRRPTVDVWPIRLQDELPIVPVPLLPPDPDAPLDLGASARAVYDRGAYAPQIDYRNPPPPPPLSEEETAWVLERLSEKGLRSSAP